MAEILKNKIAQGIILAVVGALVGGLATGWLSLPKSVILLEAKASALEASNNKVDGRVGYIEKDYVGKREMEGHVTKLDNRMDRVERKIDKLTGAIMKRLPDDE